MSVIALAGGAQSGTETAAAALVLQGWQTATFAAPLEAFAARLDPWLRTDPLTYWDTGNGHLRPYERYSWLIARRGGSIARRVIDVADFEARLADAIYAAIGEEAWLRVVLDPIPDGGRVVLTDCTRRAQADAVHARGGIVVQVRRLGVDPPPGDLDGYPFDAVVDNDSTGERLAEAVRAVAWLHETSGL